MADNKKSSIGGKSTCHLLNVKQPDRVAKRLKFSFQRTRATVNLLKLNRPVDAAMSLIDITEAGLGLYTQELLLKGSSIELCITEPRILRIKGIVAWSVPVHSGILGTRYPFRSGMQFVYENETQRAAVVEFIQKVGMNPLELPRSAPASEGNNGANPADSATPAATGAPVDPNAAPVAAEGAAAAAPAPVDGAAPAEGVPAPAADASPAPVASAEAAPATPAAEAPPSAPAADAAPAPAAEATPVPTEGDGEPKAA